MTPLLTRRRWTAALAALPLAAQIPSTVPPVGVPAPSTAPLTPEQRMQKALDDIRQVSVRLSKIDVPMSVEPAFSFRA